MAKYTVRIGGLMRCCLATLEEAMDNATSPPKEGDRLQCKYHGGEGMMFRYGAWEWARAHDIDPKIAQRTQEPKP